MFSGLDLCYTDPAHHIMTRTVDDLVIGASLDVCALPAVKKINFEIRSTGEGGRGGDMLRVTFCSTISNASAASSINLR